MSHPVLCYSLSFVLSLVVVMPQIREEQAKKEMCFTCTLSICALMPHATHTVIRSRKQQPDGFNTTVLEQLLSTVN